MVEVWEIYRKPPFWISKWRTTYKYISPRNLLPLHSTTIFLLFKVVQLEFPNHDVERRRCKDSLKNLKPFLTAFLWLRKTSPRALPLMVGLVSNYRGNYDCVYLENGKQSMRQPIHFWKDLFEIFPKMYGL